MEQSFIRLGGVVILTFDADASLDVFKSYGIVAPWREFRPVSGNYVSTGAYDTNK